MGTVRVGLHFEGSKCLDFNLSTVVRQSEGQGLSVTTTFLVMIGVMPVDVLLKDVKYSINVIPHYAFIALSGHHLPETIFRHLTFRY